MKVYKYFGRKVCAVVMALALIAGFAGANPTAVNADVSTADPSKYTGELSKSAAYQYKDVFEAEKVKVNDLTCCCSTQFSDYNPKGVELIFFNTVTQEIEQRVKSDNDGMIKNLYLKKNHNYIIYTMDEDYSMKPAYVWVDKLENDGKVEYKLRNIKSKEFGNPEGTYTGADEKIFNDGELDVFFEINLLKVSSSDPDVKQNRYHTRAKTYKNGGLRIVIPVENKLPEDCQAAQNVEWTLTSQYETLTGNTGTSGVIDAYLLEDIAYTLTIEDKTLDGKVYTVDTIPIVVKDHSERRFEGGDYADLTNYCFTYDHRSCDSVSDIPLVLKSDAHKNDTIVTSYNSGNTTVSGIDFKHETVCEQLEDIKVPSLEDGTYDVVNIKMINTHRWEVTKFCAGSYKVNEKLKRKEDVKAVYELKDDGSLNELAFTQSGSSVEFETDTLSMYPVVIEYQHKWNEDYTVDTAATAESDGQKSIHCSICEEIKPNSEVVIPAASECSLSAAAFSYTGKQKNPDVTVKDREGKDIDSSNYDVKVPSGRKNVGVYTYVVKFKGDYSGDAELKMTIKPAKTNLRKLSAGKKALKAYWTRKSPQVTGYQLRYSTSSKFSNSKKPKITSYKTTAKTIKGLKAGKKYYVQVRTYKTVNGKPYYSSWSSTKSVRVK